MRTFVLLALVATAVAARPVTLLRPAHSRLAVSPEMVDRINNHPGHKASFVAGESEFFKGMTEEDAVKLLGTRLEADASTASLPAKTMAHIADTDIPASFDARQQWPKYIHPIRNQMACGSCWAFAASEALSDRFAIATNGTVNVVLSPEDLVSCDSTDMGCQGGYLANAWKYLQDTGIVADSCFPYTAGTGSPAKCESKCVDSEQFTKYKVKDSYQLSTVEDIQKAVMTNGPVEAGFVVYKSFMAYQSGVYKHHWWMFWDKQLGGHAVKIVGWGEDATEGPYWIIANSWSEQWGEEGFFRMRRGTNECSIEASVFAGHPAV